MSSTVRILVLCQGEFKSRSPAPSEEARSARRQFVRSVVNLAQGFAHRLEGRTSCPSSSSGGISAWTLTSLETKLTEVDQADVNPPNFVGKTLGIYTLSEGAGCRAKAALEEMFPGARIIVNSGTVATQ